MREAIDALVAALKAGDEAALRPLLAPEVAFLPPTYWARWEGPEAVAAVLGHVAQVFEDFSYRRVMGSGRDWALEFRCRIGGLDAVGVDLVTFDEDGRVALFEVCMRPHRTVGALREAMNARVAGDPRFAALRPMPG